MADPVSVNLNVNVDASGTVNVYSQAPTVPAENIIISQITAPVSILYNGINNGLIKFKGSGNTFTATRNSNFTTTHADITNALNAIITNNFNAANSYPFNLAKYSNNSVYQNYASFGHLALASYTDFLLGHVAATAAIDNDTTFISRMNGEGSADAKIASKFATDILSIIDDNCLNITQQVLGQDASRATNADNDGSTADDYQTLEFKEGDSIFLAINLTQPTVTMLNSVNLTQLPSIGTYTTITYYLKIYLSASGGGNIPVDTSGIVSINSVTIATGVINYSTTESRTAYLRIKDYGVTTNYTGTTFITENDTPLNYTTLLGIPVITHSAQSAITFMDAATNQPISNTLNLGNPSTIGGLTITNINVDTGVVSYSTTAPCTMLVFVVTDNTGVDTFYDGVFDINNATTGSIAFSDFAGGVALADLQGKTLSVSFRYNHYERASVNGVLIGSGPAPAPGPAPSGSGWELVPGENQTGSVTVSGVTTTFNASVGQMMNFRTVNTSVINEAFMLTFKVLEVTAFNFALFSTSGGPPIAMFGATPTGSCFFSAFDPVNPIYPTTPYAIGDVITITYDNSNNALNVFKNMSQEGFPTPTITISADSYRFSVNIGTDTNETIVSFENLSFA
jgi:hypothetical protein